jgi:hypothetical protein
MPNKTEIQMCLEQALRELTEQIESKGLTTEEAIVSVAKVLKPCLFALESRIERLERRLEEALKGH